MVDIFEKQITFLISSLGGGGSEGVCVNLANGLASRGWCVTILVLNLTNSVNQKKVSEKVKLINFNVKSPKYALLPLKCYLKRNKTPAVIVFVNELAMLLVLIRKIFLLDLIVIARNNNNYSSKMMYAKGFWRKNIVLPMMHRYYSEVDHVINQCKAMEEDLLRVHPKLSGKTSFIYNPVNQGIEEAARRIDFNEVEKQNYILCIGRLEEQKAFHYAIRAFAKIVMEYPCLRLRVVGQGSLESDLKQEAIRLGVSGNIDFEGYIENTVPLYLKAKATLLTSMYEGFPNVLVESLVLGTPIISFDCDSGPAEIVEEGVNGYLIKDKDSDGLHRCLQKFMAVKSVKPNPKKYIEKYGVEKIITQYEGVINYCRTQ